jgi:hypothetical protein
MFQSVHLLLISECKLFCLDVKHGVFLFEGGRKVRYIENILLRKY